MARRSSFQPQRDPKLPPKGCDHPGCAEGGEFRAPKDRSLRDYHWFCLEHVRAFNAGWDFYKGMPASEIEAGIRHDTGWQRPTWPLGRLGRTVELDALGDPFGLLRDAAPRRPAALRPAEAPPELRAALGVLELPWPLAPEALKARYKELAKRHHPDANRGDKRAEERFKDIARAYALLRARLGEGAARAPAAG
ncbi:J domain-containing protein [Roseococcus sp. DSY-14]|uniref:J domain-containing protein n=1 Tax=Roseococcus sp. DSY-14 TaxID=3369650 RepID=UPI00387AD1C0